MTLWAPLTIFPKLRLLTRALDLLLYHIVDSSEPKMSFSMMTGVQEANMMGNFVCACSIVFVYFFGVTRPGL